MVISQADWDALIAHAQDDAPNECVGFARLSDGRVDEVHRAKNLRASPYGYEIDPQALLAANDLDDEGYGVAIYHSHPRSPAEPSQTDINLAFYPHWHYLIVSLAGDPHVRAWRIEDGNVREEEIVVE
jgi:proteasome lid subunit RPN8/RPN11